MSNATLTGADGTTITIPVPTAPQASDLLASFSTAIAAAITDGTLVDAPFDGSTPLAALASGQVGFATIGTVTDPTAPIVLPAGYEFVLISATTPVIIDASGDPNVVSQYGGLTYTGPAGENSNVVAAGGDNDITLLATSTYSVVLGAGDDTVTAAGSGTVDVGGGTNVVSVGGAGTTNVVWASGAGDLITLGLGAATVGESGSGALITAGAGSYLFADGGNADTLNGAAASSATIFGGSNGLYTFGSAASSTTLFLGNPGTETINAGAGSSTVFAQGATQLVNGGSGSLLFIGGSGADTVLAGSSTATIFGSATGSVDFQGTASSGGGLLVGTAGTGILSDMGSTSNDTLFAGASNGLITAGSGTDTVFGGAGAATIQAGFGHDVFAFFNGVAGGSDVIAGFKSTDSVLLSGYGSAAGTTAVSTAVVSGGSTVVTLSDNTKITFLGVTNLSANNFWAG